VQKPEWSRRAMLVKIGLLLNGIVGVVLAVPIVRYLVSPVTRERQIGYESGFLSAGWNSFLPGRLGSPRIEILP